VFRGQLNQTITGDTRIRAPKIYLRHQMDMLLQLVEAISDAYGYEGEGFAEGLCSKIIQKHQPFTLLEVVCMVIKQGEDHIAEGDHE